MKIKNITKKIFNPILLFSILVSVFIPSFSFAQVNATWYTKSLDIHVGDVVKIDLYINPRSDHPAVTVSNTLNYDNSKLKFVDSTFPDGWIIVTKEPNFVTDEQNGFIRRTAGFPNGISTNSKLVTYEFKAIGTGRAEIAIEDGTVLDQESVDLGLQKKQMFINISPSVEMPANQDVNKKGDAENDPAKVIPLIISPTINTISVNVYGKTAIREGEDYTFTVFKDTDTNQSKSAKVDISVLNSQDESVYSYQKSFGRVGPASLDFIIPKIVLKPGEYSIQIRKQFEDSNQVMLEEKQIAVLASDKDWFDRNRNEFFVIFGIIIVFAWLYHIHKDHIIFRRLRVRGNKKR